jgi:hypothetical protein
MPRTPSWPSLPSPEGQVVVAIPARNPNKVHNRIGYS